MNGNIHLETVKKDEWEIKYIADQTEEICLTAVR